MPSVTVETILDQFESLPDLEQKRLFAALMQKLNGGASPVAESELSGEDLFHELATQWNRETRYLSSVSKMVTHPAYQRIIGMGQTVIPFILKEMEQRGGHWLWALHAITGEDPAPPDANFRDAVQAWLQCGKRKGYIA